MSIHFSQARPAHEEAYRRIVRQDKEKGLAGESYLDWFVDGVYKLDNGLGPVPALPPVAYQAPQPVTVNTLGAQAVTASAQLLGILSPISPLVHLQEAEEMDEEAAAAAAAAARQADEDDGGNTSLTADQAALL